MLQRSLDVSLKGYQNPNKLQKVLNKYVDNLKDFENSKYFNAAGEMNWGGTELKTNEYNKKVIEIILPDTIITEDTLEILKQFRQDTHNTKDAFGNIIEVWYRIGK